MKKVLFVIFIIIALLILKGCSMNAVKREFDFKTPFGEVDIKEDLDSDCLENDKN